LHLVGYFYNCITMRGLVIVKFKHRLFFLRRCDPTRVMASLFLRFLDHTQRRTTVGRSPLNEWSARRRYLYLTTHNTHKRQKFMPQVGFEPTISAGERPQTYANTDYTYFKCIQIGKKISLQCRYVLGSFLSDVLKHNNCTAIPYLSVLP
jgi:hypothetical protein